MKGSEKVVYRRKLKNKGFTLVEVLIAMGILGVIVAPMLRSFIFSYNMNAKSRHRMDAVNMSESLLEGIKGNTIEEAVTKFTTSVSFDMIDPALISTGGVSQIAPSSLDANGNPKEGTSYATLTADDGESQITTDAEGNFVFTPSTDDTKKYYFHVKNIIPQKSSYDTFIEIDPSPYKGDVETQTLGTYYHNSMPVGSVGSVNIEGNASYMQGADADEAILHTLYTKGLAQNGSSYPQIYDDTLYGEKVLYRTITVTIDEIGSERTVTITYDYTAKVAGQADVSTAPKSPSTQIYKERTDKELNNIFLFYSPLYESKGGNIHDSIVIDNKKGNKVNVYLVKQEIPTTMSLQVAETLYKVDVNINEPTTGSYADHKTTVMTNINKNLAADYIEGLDEYIDQGNFFFNGGLLAGDQVKEIVKHLDASDTKDRYFDVKIRVYESKNTTDGKVPSDKDLVYEVTGSTQE